MVLSSCLWDAGSSGSCDGHFLICQCWYFVQNVMTIFTGAFCGMLGPDHWSEVNCWKGLRHRRGLLQALNLGVWGALYSLWFTQPFRILLKVDSSGPNLRLVIGNYWIGQLIPQKWDLEAQMIVVSKCSILLSSMWIDYIISSVMGFPSIFGIYKVRFGRSQI